MELGLHTQNFTYAGGSAQIGLTLSRIARTAEDAGVTRLTGHARLPGDPGDLWLVAAGKTGDIRLVAARKIGCDTGAGRRAAVRFFGLFSCNPRWLPAPN